MTENRTVWDLEDDFGPDNTWAAEGDRTNTTKRQDGPQ